MHDKFEVLKQLANGEFVHVDYRESLELAVQLVEGLNRTWPGNYIVRDLAGNDTLVTERGTLITQTLFSTLVPA